MKIVTVYDMGRHYAIENTDSITIIQRKGAETAAETPLRRDEEIICALCAKVIELDSST